MSAIAMAAETRTVQQIPDSTQITRAARPGGNPSSVSVGGGTPYPLPPASCKVLIPAPANSCRIDHRVEPNLPKTGDSKFIFFSTAAYEAARPVNCSINCFFLGHPQASVDRSVAYSRSIGAQRFAGLRRTPPDLSAILTLYWMDNISVI